MRLALFFSRGGSLREWVDTGLFEREKLLFEQHLSAGRLSQVFWLTYGANDKSLAEKLHVDGDLDRNIHIVPMPRLFALIPLGVWLYSLLMPIIKNGVLRTCDVYRTNQMDGSWAAVVSRWMYGKPLILRTGYTISRFELLKEKSSHFRFTFWLLVEKLAYNNSTIALVSSYHDRAYVVGKHQVADDKVCILRNYIDTELFKPMSSAIKNNTSIVFVGRLSAQKNLFNLIDAVCKLGLNLDIYGQGELESELRSYAVRLGNRVRFLGAVKNDQLPKILNTYRVFVLPSLYEGMPKTLLEAMSCGLLCVGANVEGISEVLTDGITGYLAENTKSSSFVSVLKKAVAASESIELGFNARRLICDQYSLRAIEEQDWNYIKCAITG